MVYYSKENLNIIFPTTGGAAFNGADCVHEVQEVSGSDMSSYEQRPEIGNMPMPPPVDPCLVEPVTRVPW